MGNKIHKLFKPLVLLFFLSFAGCESYIDSVTYNVPENLQTVESTLKFTESVQTNLGGTFKVQNYGSIELLPSSTVSAFQLRLTLSLAVLYDKEYEKFKLNSSRYTESGQLIPAAINRSLLKVSIPTNTDQYRLNLYVDVLGDEWKEGLPGRFWAGVELILPKINQNVFPVGLTLSKAFLRDDKDNPQAQVVLFGPLMDDDNPKVLKLPGGFAFFVNLASLLDEAERLKRSSGSDPGKLISILPRTPFEIPTTFNQGVPL